MPYPVEVTIYIIVLSLLTLFFLFLFFWSPIKAFFSKRNTVRIYYETVNRVALDGDFYLINEWEKTMFDEGQGVHIDHLLIGNKFIYVIKDRYFSGAISGKPLDPSWVNYKNRRKKIYFDNPLLKNKMRADRLSLISGLDRSFFISIVLVNDDCLVAPFEHKENDNFLVSLSRLEAFVEAQEKRNDVKPLNPETLAVAVRDLAALNERKR